MPVSTTRPQAPPLDSITLRGCVTDNLLFLAQIDILAWENEAGGDLERAKTALKELLTVEPLSVPARYFSALVLSSEGDDVNATALLKEALDIYPGDKNSSELLSVIRQRQREK